MLMILLVFLQQEINLMRLTEISIIGVENHMKHHLSELIRTY